MDGKQSAHRGSTASCALNAVFGDLASSKNTNREFFNERPSTKLQESVSRTQVNGMHDDRHITGAKKMGEVIRFVPKSERKRIRLIREARAIYDSVFSSADPVSEQRDKGTHNS